MIFFCYIIHICFTTVWLIILGSKDYKIEVVVEDIQLAQALACKDKDEYGCSQQFLTIVKELIAEFDLTIPNNAADGKELYITLCQLIDVIEQ